MKQSVRPAFTLIELLVVIAVIGVLVALLMPAVQRAREAARRSQCKSRLHQLGVALHSYHDLHGVFPSGWIGVRENRHAADGSTGIAWGAMILPQLEQTPLFDTFDPGANVDSPANTAFRHTFLSMFVCPSDSPPERWDSGNVEFASANYVGLFGTGDPGGCSSPPGSGSVRNNGQCVGDGVFFHNSRTDFPRIKDGTSTTFLVGERGTHKDQGIFSTWSGIPSGTTDSYSRILGGSSQPPSSPPTSQSGFSSYHADGAHFVFCDGHVDFISGSVDSTVYEAAATINANDQTGDF